MGERRQRRASVAWLPTHAPLCPRRPRRLLRSSLRRLHLCLHSQGGASKWVLYDSRTGAETAEDDAPAALLGVLPALEPAAQAAAGGADGTPPRVAGPANSSSSSPLAAAWRGQPSLQAASPQQAQQGQQRPQQGAPQQRVWVGLVGAPPPTVGSEGERQQHPARSPGQPTRLASAAPSPGAARSPGPAPRKLLVS